MSGCWIPGECEFQSLLLERTLPNGPYQIRPGRIGRDAISEGSLVSLWHVSYVSEWHLHSVRATQLTSNCAVPPPPPWIRGGVQLAESGVADMEANAPKKWVPPRILGGGGPKREGVGSKCGAAEFVTEG